MISSERSASFPDDQFSASPSRWSATYPAVVVERSPAETHPPLPVRPRPRSGAESTAPAVGTGSPLAGVGDRQPLAIVGDRRLADEAREGHVHRLVDPELRFPVRNLSVMSIRSAPACRKK